MDDLLDLIVYGATGFTGRLVIDHLVRAHAKDGIRWGMAGRSVDKLAVVRDALGAPADTPLLAADAADSAALAQVAGATRAVISTAGPYQLYGSQLVAACVAAGTAYLDINGEPLWMRDMIVAHEATAKSNGARIVFACGYDSIPSELGVRLCQDAAIARSGKPLRHVKGRHLAMRGGAGGGSIATGKVLQDLLKKDPGRFAQMVDPFLLTPGFAGPPQPASHKPMDDPDFGPLIPFLLAPINIKNVHRSNFLMGHPYGTQFAYDEMMVAEPRGGNPFVPSGPSENFNLAPGEGPSDEQRAGGYFEAVYCGTGDDGTAIRCVVAADLDPGHTATARMIVETALCLLESDSVPAGIMTPGAVLGNALVERLRSQAGITFSVSTG